MEKCVFIGYPDGYKGWMFYNPTTKRTVISERAEFDERYFPGLKQSPWTPEPFECTPDIPYTPVPDLGGEGDPDTNPRQDNNIPLPISPEITPVHPQEPVPNIPLTPPVNPAPLEPVDNPSPEQSLNVQSLFVALDAKSDLQLSGGRSGNQPL